MLRRVAVGLVLLALIPLGHAADEPAPRLELPVALVEGVHVPVPGTATGIGPGSHLIMEIPGEGTFGCTANFVWASGGKLYLGAAGHCFLPADKAATHGPGADYDASGVRVYVCVGGCLFGGQMGFVEPGTLRELGRVAYARQTTAGQSDYANDFGVVEIPSSLHGIVRTTLPVWDGPSTSEPGKAVGPLCLYGNSMALGETFPTMARMGAGTYETRSDMWAAYLPVTFGDSGAALETCVADVGGFHGDKPVGIITHGVPGLAYGPTVTRARTLATQAGLSLELQHG